MEVVEDDGVLFAIRNERRTSEEKRLYSTEWYINHGPLSLPMEVARTERRYMTTTIATVEV